MGNAIIYAGIAIGVTALSGIMVYAHNNQANYLGDDAVLASAAEQGAFASETGMVQLNKEQGHEDPFGERAVEIRAAYESGR